MSRQSRVVRAATVVVVALFATGPLYADGAPGITEIREVVEAHPEPALGGADRTELRARQSALQSWLVGELPAGALDEPLRVRVTASEMRDVELRDAERPGVKVVGRTKSLAHRVDLAGARAGRARATRIAGGALEPTPDGGIVWATSVASEGAAALRLHFDDLRLPPTADLFVYTLDGQAFGPYPDSADDRGTDFWSHTIMGSSAIVQLRVYGPLARRDLARIGFTLQDVGHIGPGFLPAARPAPGGSVETATGRVTTNGGGDLQAGAPQAEPSLDAFCPYNATCVENTNCGGGPSWSAKNDAENATALMLWISGAFINTCSGGLLADTDAGSQIPYFLTANHCLSRNKDARNLNVFFQFDVGCGGSCPPEWSGGGLQQVGSAVLASSQSGDYTLLQLDDPPPSGSVFMGWTTADVANADGTSLFRISHPSTAPQAYSAHTVDTSAPTCIGAARGDWIYSRDTYGATEGGSSGSPIYNSAGQVVGQLTGACGSSSNVCNTTANATVDGAFANYFADIEEFLDPSPCSPTPEVCDDGTDNDCDGATDCDDADCSGDPACEAGCVNPGGAPAGASCTSDGDCCSNKCKGPPNNKTCR